MVRSVPWKWPVTSQQPKAELERARVGIQTASSDGEAGVVHLLLQIKCRGAPANSTEEVTALGLLDGVPVAGKHGI